MRAIASSTACSGLMPSAATRWIAFGIEAAEPRARRRRQGVAFLRTFPSVADHAKVFSRRAWARQ